MSEPGGWTTRERQPVRILKLGDSPQKNELTEVEGLLVAIKEHDKFDDAVCYVLKLDSGEIGEVTGTAVIDDQLRLSDVGRIVRFSFTGWARGKTGRPYKQVVVSLYAGEPTEELRVKYPDYGKVQPQKELRRSQVIRRREPRSFGEGGGRPRRNAFDDYDAVSEGAGRHVDDDLPF